MDLKEKVSKAVDEAIDVLNEQLDGGQKLEKNPETLLLGKGGKLDSIGFVNFIVLLEEHCQSECGVTISLTDAMESTPDDNPFQTVRSLTDYLYQLVRDAVLQSS
jgi:acyl carrier protein